MAPIFAFNYGISFAAIAAVIVHTVLYQGEDYALRKGSECYCFFFHRKNNCQTISIVFKR
jgi:hypothetical protein